MEINWLRKYYEVITMGEWKTVERPGYLGKKRNEVYGLWDHIYGEGNRRIAYQWGNYIVPKDLAIQIYEDGYYEFLKNNPDTLEWLISSASDVYDTAPSNVEAKFDYSHQETLNTHLHDTAIRRSLVRLGKWFRGDHLIHVRWKDTEGFRLSPGIVSFHLPERIIREEIKDYGGKGIWWYPNTIEDFYQRNKILQVKESILSQQ
mgnify:CR=1 FL=1